MRRRSLLVSVIVTVFMLAGAPAAFAGQGVGGKDVGNARADHPVFGSDGAGVGNARAEHPGNGPSENGAANALAGSANGMNRLGSPGSWKANGHEPPANSFPQGHSPSDPDADGNGGQDKPGGTGGFDDDKDGNNGCGNDADREDDNNGWCGLKPKSPPQPPGGGGPPPPPPPPPGGGGPPPAPPPGGGGPPPPSIIPPSQPPQLGPPLVIFPPQVKETPTKRLADTGFDIATAMSAGTGLMIAGVGLRRRRR